MNLSKINRVTHRDIGCLITGLTIIYALSGIALNHKQDWNPNYLVDTWEFTTDLNISRDSFNDETARAILKTIPGDPVYKTSHFPSGNRLTIFIDGGFIQINTTNGKGIVERISPPSGGMGG